MTGIGGVDGTVYVLATEGQDHVELKFDSKKDDLTVDAKFN
jgi:hypothetical protein